MLYFALILFAYIEYEDRRQPIKYVMLRFHDSKDK